MHLKVFMFGCNLSVNYVSLFEEPCAFWAVYRLVLEGFYWTLVPRNPKMFATVFHKFVFDKIIIEGTLLKHQQTFSALFLLLFRYFQANPYLIRQETSLRFAYILLPSVENKEILPEENCTPSRRYLDFQWGVFWKLVFSLQHEFSTNNVTLFAIGRKLRGIYMKRNVQFFLSLEFDCRDSREISYPILHSHAAALWGFSFRNLFFLLDRCCWCRSIFYSECWNILNGNKRRINKYVFMLYLLSLAMEQ
jgi:hypothetical protein